MKSVTSGACRLSCHCLWKTVFKNVILLLLWAKQTISNLCGIEVSEHVSEADISKPQQSKLKISGSIPQGEKRKNVFLLSLHGSYHSLQCKYWNYPFRGGTERQIPALGGSTPVSTGDSNWGVGDSSSALLNVPIYLNNDGAAPSNRAICVPMRREDLTRHMEKVGTRKKARGHRQTAELGRSNKSFGWFTLFFCRFPILRHSV